MLLGLTFQPDSFYSLITGENQLKSDSFYSLMTGENRLKNVQVFFQILTACSLLVIMFGGNHKIVPSISPKKSWEGTAGGVILSIAVSLLFYWLFCSKGIGVNAPLGWYIVAAVVLALGSFAGDLTESALKRTCDVKDSGHWIPGMGGAFDVLDSFIYNGILFWLLVFFLR